MSGKSEASKPEEILGDAAVPKPESRESTGNDAGALGASAASSPKKGATLTRSERRRAKGRDSKAQEAQDESSPAKEGIAGGYNVALPAFEGPLDLLLHLIQQHELDIKDIPIAFVSEKYVEYIMLMNELNIDLASEYLVMAATLAHIKSKMLLPKPPVDQDDDAAEDLDPRGELVRRLLEYQKYKNAAEQLGSNSVLGRDVFVRGAPAPSVDGEAPLAQVSVFKLFDAFQRLLSKAKQTAEHHIDVDRISISERIIQLTDLLRDKGRVAFENLFDEDVSRSDLIVTFLALLEMTRLRMMNVIQDEPLAPIFVELTLADEHDEILRRDASEGDPLASLSRGAESESVAAESEPAQRSHQEDAEPSFQEEPALSDVGLDDFVMTDERDGAFNPDEADDADGSLENANDIEGDERP